MKDYMFFLYVIFSPDKLHVRSEDSICNLPILTSNLSVLNITCSENM